LIGTITDPDGQAISSASVDVNGSIYSIVLDASNQFAMDITLPDLSPGDTAIQVNLIFAATDVSNASSSIAYRIHYCLPYIASEVMARFKSGVPTSRISEIVSSIGGWIKEHETFTDIYRIGIPNSLSVPDACSTISNYSEIVYARESLLFCPFSSPSDPWYKIDDLLNINYPDQQFSLFDSNCEEAWSYTTGSRCVVIAVIDSGLDMSHPDIYPDVA